MQTQFERRGQSVYGEDTGPGTAPHIAECHNVRDAQTVVNALNAFAGLRQTVINAYLDYVNNYLTIEKWAEHNGMTKEHAERFMLLALDVLNSKHPDS